MKDLSIFFRLSIAICIALLFSTEMLQAQTNKPLKTKTNVKTRTSITTPKPTRTPPTMPPNQQEGKPNLERVDGRNVTMVDFGRNGSQIGVYKQVGAKSWKEVGIVKGTSTFEFKELNRDEWSVYLKDNSRNVSVQLDLHTKKVMYADSRTPNPRPLYQILKSSAKVNGWIVREVIFKNQNGTKKGKFVQKDGKGWVEMDASGKAVFNFVEKQRDDWSVYLFDKSRNAHIQLDLHTGLISFATGSQKPYPIYKIINAQRSVGNPPAPVITKPAPPKPKPNRSGSNASTTKPDKNMQLKVKLNTPKPEVFSHLTTKENTQKNYSKLDNPITNKNKNAIVFITPNWKSAYNATEMGVYWHNDHWRVFNQDRYANIETNYQLNVLAYPTFGKNVFVHQATKETIGGAKGHMTYIEHPYADGASEAKLIITQNYGENTKGVYNNHTVGVSYDKKRQLWAIYNQDLSPIPENAQFNVLVLKKAEDAGLPSGSANLVNHKSSPDNLVDRMKHVSIIPAKSLLNNPNLALFITSSWDTGVYNRQTAGVYYHGSKWSIYSRDKKAFPENAYFNVLAIDPTKMNKKETRPPSRKESLLKKMNRNRPTKKNN